MAYRENINVTVSTGQRDYKVGDFINALDELCCWFINGPGNVNEDCIADALDMYARHLKDEGLIE